MPFDDPFGGDGGGTAVSSKTIKKNLRNAVAKGNIRRVKNIATTAGFSDRDRKALVAIAKKNKPDDGGGGFGGFVNNLTSDAANTIKGTAVGLPKLGLAVAKDATALPRLGINAAQGDNITLDDILTSAPGVGMGYASGKSLITGKEVENAPFSSGIGLSFRRTGQRLTHPKQAAKEYYEHPFSTAVEDAGNIAVVGAGAAKALRASGALKTATAVERVNEAMNRVSGAPFLPVSGTARTANRVIAKVSTAERMAPLMDYLKQSPRMQQTKSVLRGINEEKSSASNRTVKTFVDQEKLLPKVVEQETMYLLGEGHGPALLAASRELPPEAFAKVVEESVGGKYSPEAVSLAIDVLEGRNPKLAQRIEAATELGRSGRTAREEGYLERGPESRQEQTGYAPLTDEVANRTAKEVKNVARAEKIATQRAERATQERLALEDRAKDIAAKSSIKREQALELQDILAAKKAGRSQELGVQRSVKGQLKEALDFRTVAEKEYRALSDQLQLALRNDPNWAGLPALRTQTLESYQRYSDSITAVENLREQVGEVPEVGGSYIRVPKRQTPQDVLRRLPATGRVQYLEGQAGRAQRLLEGRQAQLDAATANARTSLEAAPARLRPLLQTNRAVQSALTAQENALRAANLPTGQIGKMADDIAVTLDHLEEQGIDVEHFINPRESLPPSVVPQKERLPKQRRSDESRNRTMRGEHDMTIKGQAKAEIRRAHQVIEARGVLELAELPFMKKAGDMVDWSKGGRLPTRAELNAQGLETWTPSGIFDTTSQIGPGTIVGPKPVIDAFRGYYDPKRWERALELTYDKGTRAFKTVVLPLSVAWNTGNAITNAFMAVLAGGVDPVTLTRMMGKSIAEYKRTGEWAGPERLYTSGSTHETLDFLGARKPGESKVGRVVRSPVRAGYKVNETVDNVFRSAVYLAKKRKGYSDEAAMTLALRAMGDFTKMAPFEQSVVRRVIPFYAWLRHMSQIAIRLPIEHPYRTAWILGMSEAFKDQEAWETLLPGYMQGNVPFGGDAALSVQNFMPFSNPLAITQVGKNLNPLIKLGLVNLPGSPARGINSLTGLPYTRPPGTGRENEQGKEMPTAPSILEQLRGIPPQLRAIDALTGRKDVARYESGDVVLIRGEDGKRHKIPIEQSTLRTLSKYVGIGVLSRQQMKQIVDSIIARKVSNWKKAHPEEDTTKEDSGGGGFVDPFKK